MASRKLLRDLQHGSPGDQPTAHMAGWGPDTFLASGLVHHPCLELAAFGTLAACSKSISLRTLCHCPSVRLWPLCQPLSQQTHINLTSLPSPLPEIFHTETRSIPCSSRNHLINLSSLNKQSKAMWHHPHCGCQVLALSARPLFSFCRPSSAWAARILGPRTLYCYPHIIFNIHAAFTLKNVSA